MNHSFTKMHKYLTALLLPLAVLFVNYFLLYFSNPAYFGIATFITLSLVGAFFVVHAIQVEQLRKEQLKSRYDSLKEQVNPHFLFNSLNSLSSLIAIDPGKAEEFVEEMSRVYRYLLRSNEKQLTTLQNELDFIESYNLLLKIRFGNGFQPVIRIEERMKEYLLPPMTLQLLIENTVKHNIVDADTPLTVQLYTQDEKLVVSNNLQKKSRSVASGKIGLRNIISKYKLLNCPSVVIKETTEEFRVVLPLIKNNH
jgi:LytS/YehU family sensor histidine kinase